MLLYLIMTRTVSYWNQTTNVYKACLLYTSPEYEIYTRYKTGDTEKEGLSSPIVGRMTEDKDGNLWICTRCV